MADEFAPPVAAQPGQITAADPLAAPAELPHVDDILDEKPDVDALLGPNAGPGRYAGIPQPPQGRDDQVMAGPEMDAYLSQGPVAKVLSAFGQGAKEGWGGQDFGEWPKEVEKTLRDAGIYNDLHADQQGLVKAFNEALIRPAATALNAAVEGGIRAGSAAFHGLGGAAVEAGLPKDIAAIVAGEAFPAGHLTGFPSGISAAAVNLQRARSLGVIGGTEAEWAGTAPRRAPTVGEIAEPARAAAEETNAAPEITGRPPAEAVPLEPGIPAEAPEPAPPAPAHDVHAVARQVAPETFQQYDALAQRRDTFRRWIDELAEKRAEQPAAVAAQKAIDGILERVGGVEDKLTKAAAGRLEAARAELDRVTNTDTADMARVRADLQKVDYAMRDLAPEVSAAYREAGARVGPDVDAVRQEVAAEPARAAEPVPEAAPVEDVPREAQAGEPAAPPNPAEAGIAARETASIADRVAADLVTAGRPQAEANAAAAVIAAHYEARAERFQGQRGTAADLYAADAPTIEGGRAGGRKGEAAGKTVFKNGEAVITLFEKADASTFIHETGHHWLEELMADARHEAAPADLAADAQAVRDYIGAPAEGPIPTRAHEKFARAFEQYMREGHAPSEALASVFSQFKDWLTAIYDTVKRLGKPISPDIKGVFDRMISNGDKPIVAAEREAAPHFAEKHETLARDTPAERAAPVADEIRVEADDVAHGESQEIAHEIGARPARPVEPGDAGPGPADRGNPPARPEADRHGDAGQSQPQGPRPGAESGALGARGAELAPEGQGGAAVAERAGKAKQRVADPLYEKLPKEPPRLVQFLRQNGGLQDDTFTSRVNTERGRADAKANPSDLRSMGAGDVPGLIKARNGMALDDAALKAWEEGYFPELRERPTIEQFKEALRDDMTGRARYSEHDKEAADAYHAAVDRNAEIDRLAERLGIDANGKTRAQFFAEASERMSAEEMASEAHSQAEAHVAELAEAERLAREEIEARGDAWEPERLYKEGEARSLEDLENDYRSEDASGGPPKSKGVAGEPDNTGGGKGSGEASPGPRGNRAGAGPTEAPLNPAEPFAPAETGLVDKAGNIRIDNLGVPEDVAAGIREAAVRNNDFVDARRGVIPDAQVLDMAEALGMDPTALLGRKLGEAFNAEEIVQARKLLIQSATELRDLAAKAAIGTDADVLAYAEGRARHQMIQEQVAGVTAEAGRALRAFRSLTGQAEARLVGQVLQENVGKTLFQMRREAELVAKLETPAQISKMMDVLKQPGLKDMVIEAWISALLSGPITHAANIMGNTIVAINRPAETGLAAAIGTVRRAITGSTEGVFFHDAQAELFGIVQGAREGVIAGWQAFKTEEPQFGGATQAERHMKALPSVNVGGHEIGGKQARIPLRLLGAEDEFFKAIAFRGEVNKLAYRAALEEREAMRAATPEYDPMMSDRAFHQRVAELSQSPTEAMIAAGIKAAEYQTFQTALGPTGRAVQNFANSHILAKAVVPFVRTPINLLKYANERTPLGLFSAEVRDNLMGRNGAAARDTQIARMAVGTAIGVSVFSLVSEGYVTGGGPADPKARAAWLLEHQPYSVKIGSMWVSYNRLDPFSVIMGVAADGYEIMAASKSDHPEAQHIPAMIFGSIVKNVLNRASLQGPAEIMRAVTDPERYGENYIHSMAATVVPSILGQTARAMDPLMRETRTTLDALKAKIPGLSQTLMPKRDIWGEPVQREGGLGPDILSPLAVKTAKNDPVSAALERTGGAPAKPDRKIRGVELTDQQYDDYSRVSGRFAKMRLDAIVRQPGFDQLPVEIQRKTIADTVTHSREAARQLVMMQNPAIIQAAVEARVATLQGDRRHGEKIKQAEAR